MKLSISAITSLLILLPSASAQELASGYCNQGRLDACTSSGHLGCLVTSGPHCVVNDRNGGCKQPCQNKWPTAGWVYWRYGANGYVQPLLSARTLAKST
jgi:hypothetical protein